MKSISGDLHKYLDAIRDDLYGAPFLVARPNAAKGETLIDVWKTVLQRRAAAWEPKPTTVAGVAEFAAACAALAAAAQISSTELRKQAFALSEALMLHAQLIGVEGDSFL